MAKSYGKLILAGEHAVVYGAPAIILPIDKFCEVKISNTVGRYDSKTVDKKLIVKNNIEDEHGIVEYVVENFLREFKIENPLTLQVKINSNIPVGRGFGSSAAVITAVVKELHKYFFAGSRCALPRQDLLTFCVSCENRVHKKSSGADIYATWFGKPIWFQKRAGKREFKELKEIGGLMKQGYYLIDTGHPVESTGDMVQIAAKLKNSRTKFFEEQINLIEKETRDLADAFYYNDTYHCNRVGENVYVIEKCLEKIGVVSEKVKNFISDLREIKIPAKICGAGGKTNGSGVVLAITEDKHALDGICCAYNYSILDVKIPA